MNSGGPTAIHTMNVSDRMRALLQAKLPDRSAEELEIQLEECLKFLTIASEVGENFFPLSGEVDEVWHELVCETREYQQLCAQLPSGRFLHHSAITLTEYIEQRGRRAVVQQLLAWIPKYVNRFGDFTEERAKYWVMCNFLRNELRLSLDDINKLGRNSPAKTETLG